MTNYSGNYILPCYINKKDILSNVTTMKLKWPNQKMPLLLTFHVWRQILATIAPFDTKGRLKQSLGNWLLNPVHYMNITSGIDKDTNNLFILNNEFKWDQHPINYIKQG
jgi:hypothetical protein